MYEVGDVVRFRSLTAGKEKFHLCLGKTEHQTVFVFLFLNSGTGYQGDYVLEDGQISGLPRSPTGKTVVSFSMLVRVREDKLSILGATKTGAIDAHLAGELLSFAKSVRSLTPHERSFVTAALETLFT